MAQLNPEIDHLLRRAGFGVSLADADTYRDMSPIAAVAHLVDYEGRPDDVDERIGRPDHVQVSKKDLFAPDIDIEDARERWLFRMIHTRRPLQEKMALFWHNHFATAYSKLAADSGERQGAKLLAHKPGALRGPQGQIELFRQYALGNFRDLLLQVAQDPAMVIWLDGKSNTKAKPQENFGREIMELFTVGVGYYTEPDVYAAARVFTGWNLRGSDDYRKDEYGDLNAYQEFVYNANQHDTNDKTFSFPIYGNGSRTIAARSESAGMQDGIDLITALATHPETARRLARKFWSVFISEIHPPDPNFLANAAATYLQSGTEIRPMVRYVLTSPWFNNPTMHHARYSSPAEYVVRAIKEVGWQNLSLDKVRSPLAAMGQQLFEPPNVAGWPPGAAWFSTGTMLARTNFAAALASSQKQFIAASLSSEGGTPQALLAALLERVTPAPLDSGPQQALMSYLGGAGTWIGGGEQLNTRAAGLARLLVGSSEYQLV
ncbi:MAG TPA: DUF1800 domain-containing protein [Vicinamibacterales bacterium]|nr:DUF1800 domain-containing protein [Vicinamibacterales bacterium]